MIQIDDLGKCCGCGACRQRCPKECITLVADQLGFLYPEVDAGRCIECGLCVKVCPMLQNSEPKSPLAAYAAVNTDKAILHNSASGGVFTALARVVLDEGGVVFGACYDSEWQVRHAYASDMAGLDRFRGSKYSQSVIGSSYIDAEKFLKDGRKVLFSGTPCQIAGLHSYLRRSYEGLLYTVEIICHGIPSPKVWSDYLSERLSSLDIGQQDVIAINMRDKQRGWLDYSLGITYRPSGSDRLCVSRSDGKDEFMKGFIANLYVRPSCFECPFKSGRSCADMTIGDFWGIETSHPDFYNPDGVSVAVIRTVAGADLFHKSALRSIEVPYSEALKGNPVLEHSTEDTPFRNKFIRLYLSQGVDAIGSVLRQMRPGIVARIVGKGKKIISKIF